MVNEFIIQKFALSIHTWLNYNHIVGRKYIINESMLKFPAAEYSNQTNIKIIETEYGIPNLSQKRFDLFVETNKNEQIFFEFKFIKSDGSTRSTEEKKRIFSDIMRLFLNVDSSKTGYFLICGNKMDFCEDFQNIKQHNNTFIKPVTKGKSHPISEGFYTEWFSFDQKNVQRTFNIENATDLYCEFYDSFLKDYSPAYNLKTHQVLQLPKSITTELISIFDTEPYELAIWKIHPSLVG